jgi:hypothetical protein
MQSRPYFSTLATIVRPVPSGVGSRASVVGS